MNRVATFDELAAEFHRRVSRIVWCTLATVAPDGTPWTRVLHPIWEASTGWIATTRHGLKARHLARDPRVSLTYWDAAQDVVTVHATAAWADDAPTRERVWQLYRTTPPPLGYDPGDFWPAGPDDPAFGLLRLRPDPDRYHRPGLIAQTEADLATQRHFRRVATHPLTDPSKTDAQADHLPTLSTGMTGRWQARPGVQMARICAARGLAAPRPPGRAYRPLSKVVCR